ncbi:uncharacterized protein LOC143034118 [Oratosquilla oratoria]|uniref:uncharacterized protein LOC143034118 n=1 Tax=Oratosquilla oratoria TaxID=337810 RepID=UPI003F75B69D
MVGSSAQRVKEHRHFWAWIATREDVDAIKELANQRRKKIEERKQIRLVKLAEREKKRLRIETQERKKREKEEKDRIREEKREPKINGIKYIDENARKIRVRKSTKECLPPLVDTLGGFTTEDKIEHHIGNLGDVICPLCGAKRWQGEMTTLCCSRGQSVHPPLTPLSPLLEELYKGETQLSRHFLNNIYNFNNMFCFTSFATSGSLENASESVMTYKIKGHIYHRLGVLKPRYMREHTELDRYLKRDEKDVYIHRKGTAEYNKPLPKYLDLYFYCNSEKQIQIRANQLTTHKPLSASTKKRRSNEEKLYSKNFEIVSILQGYLTANNAVLKLLLKEFKSVVDLADSKTKQLNKLPDVRITLRTSEGKRIQQHKGTYDLPTARSTFKGRALFQKFVVDNYVKIETFRLSFFEANQRNIRKESFDVLQNDDPSSVGQRIIIPPSFVGGPRYMKQKQQDALTFIGKYGSPDLFITFTMNPDWPEFETALAAGCTSSDRPDLVSRVFRLKLCALMDDLTKICIFGRTKAFLYTVEWQKRGLPHCHVLLWLEHKIDQTDIDNCISAEIPDPNTSPRLYKIVTTNMKHNPCVGYDESSPCICIAYVTKYVNKGSDRIIYSKSDGKPVNEIRNYRDARYVNANEATWRIFNFHIHKSYPPVTYLPIHLEGEHKIFYVEEEVPMSVEHHLAKVTQLMAFFKLCENDVYARTLLYTKVPTHYVFCKKSGVWTERSRGSISIGRMQTTNSKNAELSYLRLMLSHVRGPKSFSDIRTVEGVEYATYREAVKAMGLVKDKDHWEKTLMEIVNHTNNGKDLRST